MEIADSHLSKVMKSVYERTRAFLRDELDVEIMEVVPAGGNFNALALRDITAIVGLGGPVGVLVSFSFSRDLIETLFQRFTDDIDVPPEEHDLYISETASEIINTVLGHCTSDLAESGQRVTMSPPVIVEDGKTLRRDSNALFATICLKTDKGQLDVNFVGSRETFDTQLIKGS